MYKIKLKNHKQNKLRIGIVIVVIILILSSNFFLIIFKQTAKEKKYLLHQSVKNEQRIKENLTNMKVFFTKNQGQFENDEIYFTCTASDKSFGFCESSVLIKISKTLEDNKTKFSTIKKTFENSNKVIPDGQEELNHKSNYFFGNDSSKWKSNVLNYEKIVYENLYEGIDLIYYFNEKGLKYDWVVKPNADPKLIIERFEGINSLRIDSEGGLIIKTEAGELKEDKPYSYQNICGNIIAVDASFRIIRKNSLAYEIGDYKTSEELIIDPLIYSTFIGGNDDDDSFDIALDTDNNVYITGRTYSLNFPTTSGCFDDSYNGTCDVFVFELNSEGSELLYSTYVGGSGSDGGMGIVLDFEKNAYITGYTSSKDFPTSSECFDDSPNGNYDVFVLKLNSDGSDLLYSSFIGGSNLDRGRDITLDSDKFVYITGYTESSDLPTTSNCFDDSHNGDYDGFISKLNLEGSSLLCLTYIGGGGEDWSTSITLDSENNIYITGGTKSSKFPSTSGCFDDSHNGNYDGFITKLNSEGSSLIYSTFVEGSDSDWVNSIVLDSENNTYITGGTQSSDFPTTYGCVDDTHNGNNDVFVFKLNTDGSDFLYSTYIGGEEYDNGNSITLDSENNIYITGGTKSSNFPTTFGCFDNSINGKNDIFVFKLDSDNSKILYSTFIGGSAYDGLYRSHVSIVLENKNVVYVSSSTNSSDFPTSSGCFDDSINGKWDVFVFKLYLKPIAHIDLISPNPALNTDIVHFSGHGTAYGNTVRYSWRTDKKDLYNDTNSEFYYKDLSGGTHTIYFKVQDSYGLWSNEVSENLTVHEKPVATIDSISPNPALDIDNIQFQGNGNDDGNVEQYSWKSSIDGEFYNGTDSKFYCDNLTNGKHTIYFKVKDNFGVWSEIVTQILEIKEKKMEKSELIPILKLSKTEIKEGESITLDASESTGVIAAYFFDFGDGTNSSWIANSTITHKYSTEGTYAVKLKVKDKNGIESNFTEKELKVSKKVKNLEEKPKLNFPLYFLLIIFIFILLIILGIQLKIKKSSEKELLTTKKEESTTQKQQISPPNVIITNQFDDFDDEFFK